MVLFAPWAFGAVHPIFELLLMAGLAAMLLLWGTRWVVSGQVTWQRCPVALCLAGLVLFGAFQMVNWPGDTLERIAPASAGWRQRLLPAQPEGIPDGSSPERTAAALSLYPTATRRAVAHLIAVLLLFAVVRNTYASDKSLRRLAVVAAGNGVLLSLFSLMQAFGSANNQLYWRFGTDGEPFGPFVCRNHFPFFLNLCACLLVGLLMDWSKYRQGHRAPMRTDGYLWNPAFWGGAALALLFSSVLLSQSRGGIIAFLVGMLVCVVVTSVGSSRRSGIAVLMVLLALVAGLTVWFGPGLLRSRLNTLWEGTALAEWRLPVWSRNVPLIGHFFPWGSGYGTYALVEPLSRLPGDVEREGAPFTYDFAHNDYLEALIEGGGVRLALSLLAIYWVYQLGVRAYARYRHRSAQGLVLGALAAFTTAVVHSFGEFGLHIPAVVLLLTIVAAHLAALGAPRDARTGAAEAFRWRLGGLAPLVGLAVLVFLAFRLVGEEWGLVQADRYRLAADLRTLGKPVSAEDRRLQLEYLQAAVAFQPGDALLHTMLADAHLLALEVEIWRPTAPFRRTFPARAVLTLAPVPPGFPALGPLPALGMEPLVMSKLSRITDPDLERAHLGPALEHYVRARNLCPLQARAQAAVGSLCEKARHAEPRLAYLERAALLRPADAEIAYLLGAEQLRSGQPAEAYASWRRCLSDTDKYLPDVLAVCAGRVPAETLAVTILPGRVEVLVKTALQLYPGPEGRAQRQPFLDQLAALAERRSAIQTANDHYLYGVLLEAQGQPAAALRAWEKALSRAPNQADWRLEYARLLYQTGRLDDALKAVQQVLEQAPQNVPALALHKAILYKLTGRE
jgi:tetratricopeptide (TPR) repeat protein